MSSISKLQIRGIRSYNPLTDATIEFYSPLTMIVGQNGCGKTTIIESLKYSCTGSLPPNAKSGQSLVNDPGMTDSNEVKASIKLLFHNKGGKTCVAVRSLQVSKKKTKLEFKALDAVLKTKDVDGTTSSIGMKCSDMDRVLPESLGVSPAILENVIFVHQEDSSWPMQEGKVLKTRFDDIFESTRYTKALEALMKTKKDMQSRAKTLNGERLELSAHLHSAEQSKKEMAEAQSNQELIEEELTTIGNLLERTEMKIKQVESVLQAAQNNARELQKLQWQVTQGEQRVTDKTSSLEKRMDGSDEELSKVLNNFEVAMTTKQREMSQFRNKSETAQREIETVRQEILRLNQKKGQADSFQDQSEQQRQAQLKLLTTLSQKLQILAHLNVTTWNSNTIKDALTRLQAELTRLQDERAGEVKRLQVDVKELSSVVESKRNDVQKLEIELNLKNDEARGLQQESQTKRLELSRIAASRGNQANCQLEYDTALRQHEEFYETYNNKAAEFKRQLKESSDRIRDLQEEIVNDSQLLQELGHHRHEMAATEANLKQIDNELSTILTDIATLFATNMDNLRTIPQPTMPLQLGEILPQLEGKATQHKVQVDNVRSELNTVMTERATKEAILEQKKQAQRVLRDKTIAINELDRERISLIERHNLLITGKVLVNSGEDVHQLAADATADMILDAARAAEAEARDLRMISKASKGFLRKLNKELKKRPDSCPCCQQMMNAAVKDTYTRTVSQLFSFTEEADHITDADYEQALQETGNLVANAQALQKRMLPLADARIEFDRLDHEISDLSRDITDRQASLKQLETRLQIAENEGQSSSRLHRELQDLHIRWRNIETRKNEFLDRKRRQTDSLFTADLNNRSIDDVERGVRDKQDEKDRLQARKDKLTNDEAMLTKRSFALRNNLTEKEKALSDARLEGSRAEELQIAVDTLTQKLTAIDTRKTTLIREKEQIERELAESSTHLNTRRQELQQRDDHFSRRLRDLTHDRDSLAKMTETLEGFEARYKEMNLGEVARQLEEAERVIQARKEELKTQALLIKQLEKELTSQEQTKRNILGNIELRQVTRELHHLREELQAMEKQQGASARQFNDSQHELTEAQRQREELQSQRDTLRGRMAVHRQQVVALQAKLNDPTYRGVEERSRRKNIEYETTNMAASDIEIYHNTLDRAVQQFHSLKIREINKSIHTLWQQIYRGQDIDTIEIESGHDIGDGTEERATTTSRSYNYRVVMKKGDLPLDMRGRCSAGQKVLAAIVIRLALAETFCVNCGILALDEPTTNLDDQNKEGLAEALALLIAARSNQQNFQLVCITHDLDFVRAIQKQLSLSSEESTPSHYFRVFRQEEGTTGKHFSHIERIAWEDM